MATNKIHSALNIDNIFCTVTCPECEGTVTMKMRNPTTRKTCPKWNRCTYVFTITSLCGFIHIAVMTIGSDETPTDYEITSGDIEVIEDAPQEEDTDA